MLQCRPVLRTLLLLVIHMAAKAAVLANAVRSLQARLERRRDNWRAKRASVGLSKINAAVQTEPASERGGGNARRRLDQARSTESAPRHALSPTSRSQ